MERRSAGEFIAEQVVVDRGVWELCDGCEKIGEDKKAVVVKWRIPGSV